MATQGRQNGQRQVDTYGRIVQITAIIAFVIMIAIDQQPNTHIDAWQYGGMLGIAIGAKPDDLVKLLGGRK